MQSLIAKLIHELGATCSHWILSRDPVTQYHYEITKISKVYFSQVNSLWPGSDQIPNKFISCSQRGRGNQVKWHLLMFCETSQKSKGNTSVQNHHCPVSLADPGLVATLNPNCVWVFTSLHPLGAEAQCHFPGLLWLWAPWYWGFGFFSAHPRGTSLLVLSRLTTQSLSLFRMFVLNPLIQPCTEQR